MAIACAAFSVSVAHLCFSHGQLSTHHRLEYCGRHLTAACHAANPRSLVVWYDALTTQGLLQWQDTLNELNADFFQASDALFVNYTWKAGTPAQAAAAAGTRHPDVYMGIDVFGRSTFGGGGFSCDVAAAAARLGGVPRGRSALEDMQHEHVRCGRAALLLHVG